MRLTLVGPWAPSALHEACVRKMARTLLKLQPMQTNGTGSGSKGRSSRNSAGANSGRNEHVTRHLACVDRVVKRLARRLPRHVDLDDLRSAGMIGLIEAAERFDPTRNENFEAFAEFRIRGA